MSIQVVTSPVVQAVTDALTAAMVGELGDVKVLAADDPLQSYALRSITIGGTWDPDVSAFVTDETIRTAVAESGASRHRTETTQIDCIAYAGSANDEIPVHQASVGAILAAAREAVTGIRTVGGASTRAQIPDERWAQGGDDKGTLAMVMFTVQAVRLL